MIDPAQSRSPTFAAMAVTPETGPDTRTEPTSLINPLFELQALKIVAAPLQSKT